MKKNLLLINYIASLLAMLTIGNDALAWGGQWGGDPDRYDETWWLWKKNYELEEQLNFMRIPSTKLPPVVVVQQLKFDSDLSSCKLYPFSPGCIEVKKRPIDTICTTAHCCSDSLCAPPPYF